MKYVVWIVSPPAYPHSPGAFMEVAIGLRDGLIELGHEAEITTFQPNHDTNTIILGAQLLQNTCIPDHFIIYNLEQLTPGSPWLTGIYPYLVTHFPVWDYSQSNIDELKKLGIDAKLCPIGYTESLTCIPDLTHEHWLNDQPLDVLFYGSMNPRRQKIYDEIKNQMITDHEGHTRRVNAHWAFGVYGAKRDALIARAKIVVNVHFYESKIFEIVRCSYLMANAKCVVSETGNDQTLEAPFKDAIAFTQYDNITNRIMELLANPDEQSEYCRKASEAFKAMNQSDYLEPLVGRIA